MIACLQNTTSDLWNPFRFRPELQEESHFTGDPLQIEAGLVPRRQPLPDRTRDEELQKRGVSKRVITLRIAVEEQGGADFVVDPLLVVDAEGAILEELRGSLEKEIIVDAVLRRIPDQTGQVLHEIDFLLAGEGKAEIGV